MEAREYHVQKQREMEKRVSSDNGEQFIVAAASEPRQKLCCMGTGTEPEGTGCWVGLTPCLQARVAVNGANE